MSILLQDFPHCYDDISSSVTLKPTSLQEKNRISVKREVSNILGNMSVKGELLFSLDHQKSPHIELLARPRYIDCDNLDQKIVGLDREKQSQATYYLLNLLEKNNMTFELLKVMFQKAESIINSDFFTDYDKISINTYPENILHEDFSLLIENFPDPSRIIIELTETKQRGIQHKSILFELKAKFGIEIAMDDIDFGENIHNYSKDTLYHLGQVIDRYKIDGEVFQRYVENKDLDGFIQCIDNLLPQIGENKITIEWVETKEHYDFCVKLQKHYKNTVDIRLQGYYFN